MPDSMIPFSAHGFDPADSESVAKFLDDLPPAPPNMLPIAAFPVKRGARCVYFRVERAALERIAGDRALSTPMIAQRFGSEIEARCLAVLARVDVAPVEGWALHAADLLE